MLVRVEDFKMRAISQVDDDDDPIWLNYHDHVIRYVTYFVTHNKLLQQNFLLCCKLVCRSRSRFLLTCQNNFKISTRYQKG